MRNFLELFILPAIFDYSSWWKGNISKFVNENVMMYGKSLDPGLDVNSIDLFLCCKLSIVSEVWKLLVLPLAFSDTCFLLKTLARRPGRLFLCSHCVRKCMYTCSVLLAVDASWAVRRFKSPGAASDRGRGACLARAAFPPCPGFGALPVHSEGARWHQPERIAGKTWSILTVRTDWSEWGPTRLACR